MFQWKKVYEKWYSYEKLDNELREQLEILSQDETALEDAFYKDVTFGTGGMRGIIGPGSNRMNIYTIRKAVSGLSTYLLQNRVNVKDRGVVIAYDTRHMSADFALEAAKVLGTFNIKAYVFQSIRPTPILSFAVRYFGAAAGIMITASHNPPEYNGFKVYNEEGGQVTPVEANAIIKHFSNVENELEIPVLDEPTLEQKNLIYWVNGEVDHAYLEKLLGISKWSFEKQTEPKDLSIVFTPLHGTAEALVRKGLEQLNFNKVHVVQEQTVLDPEFSTVESPNPEEHQAFQLAIELGYKVGADILLGTDPDADRLGVAVKNNIGEYTVLTGNQLGSLLLDYILRHSNKAVLSNARMLKTIVTTELGRAIASSYGVQTIDTLTGFKFIGEKINEFTRTGETFVFGFEESYGYLIRDFARDKDAVQAAVMTAEMAQFWKDRNKTLFDALHMLYEQYGYYLEGISSITLTGKEGAEKIQKIMEYVRQEPLKEIGGLHVEAIEDYKSRERTIFSDSNRKETIHLPKENVVKFKLENDSWVCLRPSGTEPKIKCYYGVCESSLKDSELKLSLLKDVMETWLKNAVQRKML